MTQAQKDAELCGLVPEENDPGFVAQHLSAYAFMRPRIAGSRVMEVGFGDGYGSAYLAEAANEVVGVDIIQGNIPRAQAKYPRANLVFKHFDGARLPFADDTFDAAGAFQVIEHVPEPQLVPWLSEIKRVLRKGGKLYVSTPNLAHMQKRGQPYHKLIYHEKEFTAQELEELLKMVFPRVKLYGLQLGLKQRFILRLKKWGFGKIYPFSETIKRYYSQVTIRDFVVTQTRVHRARDLYAVCEKA